MAANCTTTKGSGENSMNSHRGSGDTIINIAGAENGCETTKFSPSPNRPPKIPTTEILTRRKTFSRSIFSKPKSRFGEQSVQIDSKMFEESGSFAEELVISSRGSPLHTETPTKHMTPKALFMPSPGRFGGLDDGEEIYKKVKSTRKDKYKKVKSLVLMEWFLFLCVIGCLIASLSLNQIKRLTPGGLEIWKWCVLVLVTFSGLLVTKWLMHFVVLLIELNYLLKKKVVYFVYGLQKCVRICIWLCLVLITWILLFELKVERSCWSKMTEKILGFITWTIVAMLIGSLLWLLKTLLLKILASSFHVNTFFDRIQESIVHQYVLITLSNKPVMETSQLGKVTSNISQFSFRVAKKGKSEVIDMNKLHKTKRGKVSAWTMKMLVDVISSSGLTTLSNAIGQSVYDDGDNERMDKEITNEEEAIAAAYYIFRNVAEPGSTFIDEHDLRRFMLKDEVELIFAMIDVAETGHIDRKTFTKWVVKVFKGRKTLAHALSDTKTAVKQLNSLITAILVVIIIVVWLLLTGIANTKVLLFLSSQLVVAAFMFGNTCKTIFEAIIFVFVMHPFDVGDRCVIDGVHMIVEEMNILTTVFLRFDNEKIYYPNSTLATKPISNFYRSPDMTDSLDFSIDFKTPLEKIGALKEKIRKYLESNPQNWHPNHNVIVKDIENVNKITMALIFNHTMNFQNFGMKNSRKSDLLLEMKKFFEELDIRYDLLPQEVQLIESKTGASK